MGQVEGKNLRYCLIRLEIDRLLFSEASAKLPFLRQSFRRSEWVDRRKMEDNQQPSRTSTHPEPTSPPPYYNPARHTHQEQFKRRGNTVKVSDNCVHSWEDDLN